jgi:hypothetical protein
MHIHLNTSQIKPFTVIHSVRRSHAIDYAVGSTAPPDLVFYSLASELLEIKLHNPPLNLYINRPLAQAPHFLAMIESPIKGLQKTESLIFLFSSNRWRFGCPPKKKTKSPQVPFSNHSIGLRDR